MNHEAVFRAAPGFARVCLKYILSSYISYWLNISISHQAPYCCPGRQKLLCCLCVSLKMSEYFTESRAWICSFFKCCLITLHDRACSLESNVFLQYWQFEVEKLPLNSLTHWLLRLKSKLLSLLLNLGSDIYFGGNFKSVGANERWQVTCNIWRVILDTWHMTPDMRHLKCDTWDFFPFRLFLWEIQCELYAG